MDKAEKKRLKALGKVIVEKRSRELRDQIAQTNPAAFGSDDYLRNEIEIRNKERAACQIDRVVPKAEMEREFVVRPVEFDLRDIYPSIPGQFWQCTSCGDFLPASTTNRLSSSCGNVQLDPVGHTFSVRDEGFLRFVRLLGKSSANVGWWQRIMKLLSR